jgi:hypothetical protein
MATRQAHDRRRPRITLYEKAVVAAGPEDREIGGDERPPDKLSLRAAAVRRGWRARTSAPSPGSNISGAPLIRLGELRVRVTETIGVSRRTPDVRAGRSRLTSSGGLVRHHLTGLGRYSTPFPLTHPDDPPSILRNTSV